VIYNYAACELAYVKCIECVLKDPHGLHVSSCQHLKKLSYKTSSSTCVCACRFFIVPYVTRLDSIFVIIGTEAKHWLYFSMTVMVGYCIP